MASNEEPTKKLKKLINAVHYKIRKKKENGHEKAPTPPEEESEGQKSMEELQKLVIKDDDLKKIREIKSESTHPRALLQRRFTVKINKPIDLPKKTSRTVVVAHPALPDAIPVSPDPLRGLNGPKFDSIGRLVTHSIAGNYDDFYRMASKDRQQMDLPPPQCGYVPLMKPESVRETPTAAIPETEADYQSCAEMKALRNWQVKMAQRRLQQDYVCKMLQRQPQDLVMNQSDYIRSRVELCEIIDRVLPQVSSGKGNRKKSEFWKQRERFGDEENGIFATLNLTEKGKAPFIDHVGVPPLVRQEKGMVWHPANTPKIQHPWDQNYYLQCRKAQLRDLMEEEDNQHPDFEGLQVVGCQVGQETNKMADKLVIHTDSQGGLSNRNHDYEQLTPCSPGRNYSSESSVNRSTHQSMNEVKYFPALIFDGEQLEWIGEGQMEYYVLRPLEKCVIFEALIRQQVDSHLDITNNGTTAIFYYWKKLPKENPFNIYHPPVQRFYFNDSDGVILPGMTLQFPFTFKSSHCGIYSEQWLFETHPVLQGGAPIILTLRGTVTPEDKFCEERKELRNHLERMQQEHLAERLVNDLCSSICSEEPNPSPIDAYITQEERFKRNNPHLHYDHRAVRELQQIYLSIFPEAEDEQFMWNFSVTDLSQIISDMEESEKKESFLNRLEENINQMQFQLDSFKSYDLYQCGYSLLGDALDLLSLRLNRIWDDQTANKLNGELEEMEVGVTVPFATKQDKSRSLSTSSSSLSPQKTGRSKGSIHKQQIALTSSSRHSSECKESELTELSEMDPDRDAEVNAAAESDAETDARYNLFHEKMYVEVYDTLCSTVDRMVSIFSSMEQKQLLDAGYDNSLD